MPARAQGQRLPTQMLEVVIAIPNIPLRSQRPVTEKVMIGAPGCNQSLHHTGSEEVGDHLGIA